MTATAMRTHRCGDVRVAHVGQTVRLGGWVHRRRDLGGLMFLDLRDRAGLVQIAFGPETPPDLLARVRDVAHEAVVLVEGIVRARPADQRNPDMPTGAIEVQATALTLSGPVLTDGLPIPVWRTKGESLPAEELRLRYRYLDLRRPELQQNLALRHRLLQRTRAELTKRGFYEIETPMLTKPTPEGARDYLVPSRMHAGECFALPQSPQIYKQLLMMSGFDRYFQIARCFRDEDLRADRQPEFTQIDLEASFVTEEDIYQLLEELMVALWSEGGQSVTSPFPRLTYREALERFGTDRPDMRWPVEIVDLTQAVNGAGFRAFDEAIAAGGRVRGLIVAGGAGLSRKQVDALADRAKAGGAGGLATVKRQGNDWTGPLAKLPDAATRFTLADSALLVAVAGPDAMTSVALDLVRREAIALLGSAPARSHAFCWVESFPLFERDAESGAWVFAHHPFTAPHPDDRDAFLAGTMEGIRARHYDLVYNGHELGSGSIRITDPAVQRRVFEALGMERTQAEERFGFLLEALGSGAPPHGGFAVGFDRVVMLLAGADNLRDVIAFPKTAAARALFEGAPTPVADSDLADLHLRWRS